MDRTRYILQKLKTLYIINDYFYLLETNMENSDRKTDIESGIIKTIDKIDNNEVDKNSNLFTSKFDKFDKAYHYFVFYPPTSKTYLIKRYIDFLEENFEDNDDKYVYYVGKCEK